MSFARSMARRKHLRSTANFQVESLERRVLLSTAIAVFGTPLTFASSPNSDSVAVADVNGDGKPDLIVAANESPGVVGVLLGNGNGTFRPQATFAAGLGAWSVVAADVNGDGKTDLLVVNGQSAGTVAVLLGNGDGTFQAQRTFSTGINSDPESIAVADVNGDGKPDLVIADAFNPGNIEVMLGNGSGNFQAPEVLATSRVPRSVAVSDVNGDGHPDIVVANWATGDVGVFLGNGNGTFQAERTFSTGFDFYPISLSVADVNGDGKPDILVANEVNDRISVLLGNGNGTFQPQQTLATGATPYSLALSDVNGDGQLDVVVALFGANSVGVLLGNGNGTFQAMETFAVGARPNAVVVADVNLDGRPDIVTANVNGPAASVLLGDVPPRVLSIDRANPSGVVTSDRSVTYTVTFNEPVTGVDPSDFSLTFTGGVTAATPVVVSGSGAVYSVTVNGISGIGTLGLNLVDDGSIQDAAGNPLQPTGTAYFPSQATIAVGASPVWMTTADVNGDGKPDLIVANRDDNSVGVLLGNGNGTFQPQITTAASAPSFVAAADLNGDGKIDLVTVDSQSNTWSLLIGNGDGTFQPEVTFSTGVQPSSVVATDVNGDGKTDLMIANEYNAVISVLLGNGNGTFQPQITFNAGVQPTGLVVADLNGDSKPDLIVGNTTYDGVSVLLGNGNGTFQEQKIIHTYFYPAHLAVADLNGDGLADLVIANRSAGVSVLLGNGNGTFQPQPELVVGNWPYAVAVADMNGDGRPDIIVASYITEKYSSGVSVLLGNGDGTFQPSISFTAGSYPGGLVVADFNGDGRPDVAVANARSNTVTVLLGPSDGSLPGEVYTISNLDTITGTADTDYITLVQDADHEHIDWFLNGQAALGQLAINDPNGLTINGMGNGGAGGDQIFLDYSNGNPLPNIIHLNEPQPANFEITGLSGSDPLATTTLDIGRSIVYLDYLGITSDPTALVRAWISKGYNGGAWTGTGDAVTSSGAAANHSAGLNTTGIGWADSADGQKVNGDPYSIELMYTLYGDANLDGQVNSADLQRFLNFFNTPGAWDQGDFNYDGVVNSADQQLILFTFNTSLGSQATPLAVAATPAAETTSASSSGSDRSQHLLPAINATGSTTTPSHHVHPAKVAARKRR